MADEARSRGPFLMKPIWSRFLPAYRVMADAIDDGRIGDPLFVEADFGFRAPVVWVSVGRTLSIPVRWPRSLGWCTVVVSVLSVRGR